MDLIKAQVADQLQGVSKVRFPLAAETHDDVGREGHARYGGAQHVNGVAVEAGGVPARHALENPVVTGLDRKIDLLANAGNVTHGLGQRPGHVARVGGGEANPLDAFDVVHGFEHTRQSRSVKIEAVGVNDLAQQDDLARALVAEAADLVDDLGQGAAALGAAAKRHDAVGAALVAAVDDVDEAGDGAGPGGRLSFDVLVGGRVGGRRAGQVCEQRFGVEGVEEDVHGCEMGRQFGLVRMHRAAGKTNHEVRLGLFQPLEHSEHAPDLAVGVVTHRATVDHNGGGVGQGVGGSMAGALKFALNAFAVGPIHLAADGPDEHTVGGEECWRHRANETSGSGGDRNATLV